MLRPSEALAKAKKLAKQINEHTEMRANVWTRNGIVRIYINPKERQQREPDPPGTMNRKRVIRQFIHLDGRHDYCHLEVFRSDPIKSGHQNIGESKQGKWQIWSILHQATMDGHIDRDEWRDPPPHDWTQVEV